jgi:hypothetical protein
MDYALPVLGGYWDNKKATQLTWLRVCLLKGHTYYVTKPPSSTF